MYLDEAQEYSSGDPSVTVAVLDTGVWLSHPGRRGKLLPVRDFVDLIDGHADFVGDFLGLDESPEHEVGHRTHVAALALPAT